MRFLVVLFLCLAVPSFVEAKPSPYHADTFDGDKYRHVERVTQSAQDVTRAMGCPPPACQRGRASRVKHLDRTKPQRRRIDSPPRPGVIAPLSMVGGLTREVRSAVIGGRPAGCPSRFCGCGASIHLFGRIIPTLNLAANWLRFPRTTPAPNMVAARRGHVFVLKQHLAGNVWLVHDSNSGGRRTRIHPRSIAGYAIVNPRGGGA